MLVTGRSHEDGAPHAQPVITHIPGDCLLGSGFHAVECGGEVVSLGRTYDEFIAVSGCSLIIYGKISSATVISAQGERSATCCLTPEEIIEYIGVLLFRAGLTLFEGFPTLITAL